MTEEKRKVKKDDYQKSLSAYTQAMKAFHKGDFVEAAQLLNAFLEKHPSENEFVDRAQIYLTICKSRQEKEMILPKTFDDYYQYSVYKINRGEYKEALKLLEKASQMKPKEGKIFYLMADAHCLMDDGKGCLEQLKKAIQIDKYFSILAQNESDFESLRDDKKFMLITRMA